MALTVVTDPVDLVAISSAQGNGEVTDDGGGNLTERGFVYDTSSHSDPGNTSPAASDYPSVVNEGSADDPILVQRGEVNMNSSTSTVTIDLTTPVPVGKSFVFVSMRANAYQCSRTLATATLMTESGGNYTQLRIQRSFTTDTAADYQWEVISGNGFTVQTGETTMPTSGTKQSDVTISTVDTSKTFVVLSFRTNNTGAIVGYVRGKLTSTTNLQLNAGDTATSSVTNVVRWYVVSWEGATVQSGTASFNVNSGTLNTTISTVDRAKSFIVYSWDMLAFSSNSGIVATRAALSSTTNLQIFRALNSASANGNVDWFVVSHPNINVQYNTTTLTAASSSDVTITAVSDLSRTFVPTPLQGNASQTTNANTTLNDGYNTRYLDDSSSLILERGTSNNNLSSSWFVVEDQVVTFPEEEYSLAILGLLPSTTYYVRAYAKSSGNYAYGSEVNFTTSSPVVGSRGSAAHLLLEI